MRSSARLWELSWKSSVVGKINPSSYDQFPIVRPAPKLLIVCAHAANPWQDPANRKVASISQYGFPANTKTHYNLQNEDHLGRLEEDTQCGYLICSTYEAKIDVENSAHQFSTFLVFFTFANAVKPRALH